MFLDGTLGPSWYAVLDVFENADYALKTRGTAPPGSTALSPNTDAASGRPIKRGGAPAEELAGDGQQRQQQEQTRGDRRHIHFLQTLTRRAFRLRYSGFSMRASFSAFRDFVGALCKLGLEMVSMQNGTDVGTRTGTGTARDLWMQKTILLRVRAPVRPVP